MHYTVETEIDLPRERVIGLFDNTENLKRWQRGLQVFEPLEGEPGQPGARSRMVFQMGKRKLEIVETITERDLPDAFAGTYDTKGVHNVVNNRFVAVTPEKTRWISENEFRFSGFMKIVEFLNSGKCVRRYPKARGWVVSRRASNIAPLMTRSARVFS